jgi:hypothetical protein
VDGGEPVWAISAAVRGRIRPRHGERRQWNAGMMFRPPEGATRHYLMCKREKGVGHCSPRARDKRRRGAGATPAETGGEVSRCSRTGRRGDAPSAWIPRSGSGTDLALGRSSRGVRSGLDCSGAACPRASRGAGRRSKAAVGLERRWRLRVRVRVRVPEGLGRRFVGWRRSH